MNNRDFLKSFFTEHWKYMTVSAACKLDLFDTLEFSEKTITEISVELEIEEKNLELLLEGLISFDFLNKIENKYLLNNLSELLTDSHPETLKYACLNWSGDHLEAWGSLDASIKSGDSFFKSKYEINYFDFLNQNKVKLDHYHKAMFAYAKDDYKNINDIIDFNKHESLMDVGGGYGAAISIIKRANPDLECCLFDLELVTEKCNLTEDVGLVSGDFFNTIPQITEAILLSRVLHDWDDEKAQVILKNTYSALPQNGTLYLIENLTDKIKDKAALLSLNMHVITTSFERSLSDYKYLLSQSNFSFLEIKKINDLQYAIVATK